MLCNATGARRGKLEICGNDRSRLPEELLPLGRCRGATEVPEEEVTPEEVPSRGVDLST